MKVLDLLVLNKISMIGFMSFVTGMFVISLFLNYLGSKFVFNGQMRSIASVSYKYFTLITPARITFSIWGVIYSLATVVLSLWWIQVLRIETETFISFRTVILLFLVISMVNPLWIFIWVHENITLSLITMASLFALIIIANILSYRIENQYSKWVQVFFDTYMGWISVAFSLNLAVFLIVSKISIFNSYPLFWTIFVLSIITLLACAMILFQNRFVYSLVILWALIGIYLQNDPRVNEYPMIKTATLVCVFFLVSIFISKVAYYWKNISQ